MAQSHDLTFGRFGVDEEAFGKGRSFDEERMVSSGFEGIW